MRIREAGRPQRARERVACEAQGLPGQAPILPNNDVWTTRVVADAMRGLATQSFRKRVVGGRCGVHLGPRPWPGTRQDTQRDAWSDRGNRWLRGNGARDACNRSKRRNVVQEMHPCHHFGNIARTLTQTTSPMFAHTESPLHKVRRALPFRALPCERNPGPHTRSKPLSPGTI